MSEILQWAVSPEPLTGNLFAIARDMTLERSKELALVQSEKKATSFFENSQGFMCTHDLKGNFLSVNSAGDNMVNMLLARTIIHKFAPNPIITEAKNGVEALNIFKRNVPDLILMDVQMPE